MKNLLFFTLLLFALHTLAQEAYNKGDVFIDVQTGASFIGGIKKIILKRLKED